MEEANDDERAVVEADNSVKESRTLKEDEEIRDVPVEPENQVHCTEKSSTDLFNTTRVHSTHLGLVDSEGMILQVPEDSMSEAEETNEVIRLLDDHNGFAGSDTAEHHSQAEFEGLKSSSAPNEDTGDSSSDPGLDSRYIFDESPPVSAAVEEPETFHDEVP